MKRTFFILITVELSLILITGTLLVRQIKLLKPDNSTKIDYLSGQDSRDTMGESVITQETPVKTGGIAEDFYTLEEKEIGKLIDSLPIKNDRFEISTDNNNEKIIVTLFKPYKSNQNLLISWLKQNGYGDLTQESLYFNYR
jgi:hypothetical protein